MTRANNFVLMLAVGAMVVAPFLPRREATISFSVGFIVFLAYAVWTEILWFSLPLRWWWWRRNAGRWTKDELLPLEKRRKL